MEKILTNLKIENGRVFLGYGNPRAIKGSQRFTEANLNRMFKKDDLLLDNEKKSYEYRRAQFLKRYLNKAEALLDIHASHTPTSKPFIICERNAEKITKYLPIDLIVSGFEKVQPGATDGYMDSIGKIGICVECGYLGNPKSTKIAEEIFFAFLKAREHVTNNQTLTKKVYIQINSLYITKTDNFTLSKSFDDFERISKGQVIGIDEEERVVVKRDSIITFARNRKQIGEEAFLLGKERDDFV